MMLNPFKLIKFSEEQLYFENTSNDKINNKKSCSNCNIF